MGELSERGAGRAGRSGRGVVRWGLPEVLAGVLGFVLLSAAVQALGRVPALAAQPRAVWVLDQVVAGWLPLVAVVLVASYARGRRSLRADFGLRFEPLDIAIGVLAGLALRGAAVGVAELARVIAGAPAIPFSGGVGADPFWWVFTAVLAASLVTPVVEELFFRGLVLRWLYRVSGGGDLGGVRARGGADAEDRAGRRADAQAWGGADADDPGEARADVQAWGGADTDDPGEARADVQARAGAGAPNRGEGARAALAGGPAVVAVLGSALVFTVFHVTGVPETSAAVSRLVTLFLLGLVLGSLTVLTRRLGPAILTHVVFNLSVAALDLLASAQATAPAAPTLG